MYKTGDLIIYGGNGVCRVMDITERSMTGTDHEQLYYVLMPLYQNCTIYVPTNNTKVFMRPIISKEEAEQLIDKIPTIRAEAYHSPVVSKLSGHYNALLETNECSDLLELCMSLHTKKQAAEQEKRKFGAMDEKFMKRAEDRLFGELAAALDIDREDVEGYITDRISEAKRCN